MDTCMRPEQCFASSDMYQVLGCFVQQTTPDLAKALFSGVLSSDVKAILCEMGFAQGQADSLLGKLDEAIIRTAPDEDGLFHALRKDYTHLFSNPTFSAMTLFVGRMDGTDKNAKGNQIFFGRTIPGLKAFYERVGFESSIRPALREDHVAVVFELMQILRKNQGIALREGDAAAFDEITSSLESFVSNHMRSWAEGFFLDMGKHANEGVYAAMGSIGAAFVNGDFVQ